MQKLNTSGKPAHRDHKSQGFVPPVICVEGGVSQPTLITRAKAFSPRSSVLKAVYPEKESTLEDTNTSARTSFCAKRGCMKAWRSSGSKLHRST
eukprot:1160552-Pelagomonas_calceolata.AAC.17